jgi:hypothetical protein
MDDPRGHTNRTFTNDQLTQIRAVVTGAVGEATRPLADRIAHLEAGLAQNNKQTAEIRVLFGATKTIGGFVKWLAGVAFAVATLWQLWKGGPKP